MVYKEGDLIELYADAISSIHTQKMYNYYDMPICRSSSEGRGTNDYEGGNEDSSHSSSLFHNLGELWSLTNRKSYKLPYQIHMLKEQKCEIVCQATLDKDMVDVLGNFIKGGYHNHWTLDNGLPMYYDWTRKPYYKYKRYAGGFPIGFIDLNTNQVHVFNHVTIHVDYQRNANDTYSIVLAGIEPISMPKKKNKSSNYQLLIPNETIYFTYDVIWHKSDREWNSRWEIYLTENHEVPYQVHLYSFFNSLVMAFFFVAVIAFILHRNIQNDFGDDSEIDNKQQGGSCGSVISSPIDIMNSSRADELEEKGWKLLHIELLHPPTSSLSTILLISCCGIGAQLLCTTSVTIVLMALRWINSTTFVEDPLHCLLILFGLFGVLNGVVTGRLCLSFEMEKEILSRASYWSMWIFPLLSLVPLLLLNMIGYNFALKNTVPFPSLLCWFFTTTFVSACLVRFGANLGYNCLPKIQLLSTKNNMKTFLLGILPHRNCMKMMNRRSKLMSSCFVLVFNVFLIPLGLLWVLRRFLIKKNWWSSTLGSIFLLCVGGAILFGTIQVEVFFLMSATFRDTYYYPLGFLLLIFFMEILISGQVAILYGYFQLVHEGSYSWWCQFIASGIVSIFVLLYSLLYSLYYYSKDAMGWYPLLVYFITMIWVSLALFLMMGFVGLIASFWFVNVALSITQKGRQNDAPPLVNDEGILLLQNNLIQSQCE